MATSAVTHPRRVHAQEQLVPVATAGGWRRDPCAKGVQAVVGHLCIACVAEGPGEAGDPQVSTQLLGNGSSRQDRSRLAVARLPVIADRVAQSACPARRRLRPPAGQQRQDCAAERRQTEAGCRSASSSAVVDEEPATRGRSHPASRTMHVGPPSTVTNATDVPSAQPAVAWNEAWSPTGTGLAGAGQPSTVRHRAASPTAASYGNVASAVPCMTTTETGRRRLVGVACPRRPRHDGGRCDAVGTGLYAKPVGHHRAHLEARDGDARLLDREAWRVSWSF